MNDYAKLDENFEVVPCNMDESYDWAKTIVNGKMNKIIKQEVVGGYWVSTVFLPSNHSFGSTPIHFECYVFLYDKEKNEVSDFCEVWGERSSTYNGILLKHEKAKSWVKQKNKELRD